MTTESWWRTNIRTVHAEASLRSMRFRIDDLPLSSKDRNRADRALMVLAKVIGTENALQAALRTQPVVADDGILS